MTSRWRVVLALCALGVVADASRLHTPFLEFEPPDHWTCTRERDVFTCRDARPEHERDGMIVFAAKLQGDDDSLDKYSDCLGKPKTWMTDGKKVVSRVREAKTVRRGGETWVDATHDDSEIVGFRTRYVITIHDGFAVLVTFSARPERYNTMLKDVDATLKTLKLLPRPR